MDNTEREYSEEIEKVLRQPNTSCPLYATEECELLNMETCGECPVGNLSPEKREEAKRALSRLREAAPPEEVAKLYCTDRCMLSKESDEAGCFAMFDLKRRDPEGDWTVALGKKRLSIKSEDMVLPLQVSCSKKCRTRYRLFEYLPTAVALLLTAIGLVVSTNDFLYNKLFAVAPWMPILTMGVFVAVGFAVRFLMKKLLADHLRSFMITDVSEIPVVKKLMENGFTEVMDKKYGVSYMVFSKERRKTGVYSREYEPEPEEGWEEPHLCGIWPAEVPVEPETEEQAEAPAEPETERNAEVPAEQETEEPGEVPADPETERNAEGGEEPAPETGETEE